MELPNPSHAQLGAIPRLPLLGFPLLCQVGLAAASVLPAPACPHQQRFPAAEPCRLPLDEGDCQRYTLRWYYNQRVTECRPFVYSGCRGNLNRFGSKEECELHCGQLPGCPWEKEQSWHYFRSLPSRGGWHRIGHPVATGVGRPPAV
uniref:Uncharacterized protein n=1 Tax=Corvus moneduloides TaxID=1196302 RepID=A0A8C3GUV0_CORMO